MKDHRQSAKNIPEKSHTQILKSDEEKDRQESGEKKGTLEFHSFKLQTLVDQAQKEESRERRKLTECMKRERWKRHRRVKN